MKSDPSISYIAIVQQPAICNVFLVKGDTRKRLFQHVATRCSGYADAASLYESNINVKLKIRQFKCDYGDITEKDWIEIF